MANCNQCLKIKFLICLLFSSHKGISPKKNTLVAFSSKSIIIFLKNTCKVCEICSSDLLPNVFQFLDVFNDI